MTDEKNEQNYMEVERQINTLRKMAVDGEINDELSEGLLEDVAGGVYFCDLIVHTEGHTDTMGGE